MSLLRLDLNPPPPSKPPLKLPPVARYPRILTEPFYARHLPVRGLTYSFLLHYIAFAAAMLLPPILGPHRPVWPEEKWQETVIPKGVLYLPQLGGGSEGDSPKNERDQSTTGRSAPAPATSRPGLTFAGNQEVVSNPPNPTNHIQTILQPDLPSPPVIKGFVPLPNMVLLAKAPPPPPKPVVAPQPAPEPVKPPPAPAETPKPAPKVETPAPPSPPKVVVQRYIPTVTLTGTAPVEAPKLTLPATPPPETSVPLSRAPEPPPPALPAPVEKVADVKPAPVEKPVGEQHAYLPNVAESKPAPQRPQSLPSGEALSAHNLLVLSPVPTRGNAHAAVPKGEARGQFAISRHPGNDQSPQGAGTGTGNDTKTGGIGNSNASTPGGVIGGAGIGGGTGGTGAGSGVGSGKGGTGASGGKGAGRGGEGSGAGNGSGSGHGAGNGHGTGSGAGAGPGAGPFAGMTIQGAEGPAGGISIAGASKPADESQGGGSYGMMIVTTGNSGGGVGDFGIFSNEAVFTVYLNPAETADDPVPPWPLQYALLNPAGETLQDLLPPMAVKKKMPLWPQDLSGRFEGQQIALYAVINAEGKMGQFKVLQSPNSQLSDILLAALEQWIFRPATMNGRPVAVKVVLGVAISPSR